jgi:hypothetical protein
VDYRRDNAGKGAQGEGNIERAARDVEQREGNTVRDEDHTKKNAYHKRADIHVKSLLDSKHTNA